MTRRALTKEEEDQIPIYFNSPYIEDDLCYAWWEDQLVWSDLEGALWYYDENNEEISDQDFEERFPGYKHLTGIQVDKETFTTKYKGAYVRWSFKCEQWRYRNHKLVIFEESEEPPEDQDPPESEDEQAEVSQLLESSVQTVSALVTRLSRHLRHLRHRIPLKHSQENFQVPQDHPAKYQYYQLQQRQ